ncbi:MAG: hypothetical protein MI865_13600, partial [Proteobacteria bacterium]|nr:hypothetical protein [Pseudomonadota bacterium]
MRVLFNILICFSCTYHVFASNPQLGDDAMGSVDLSQIALSSKDSLVSVGIDLSIDFKSDISRLTTDVRQLDLALDSLLSMYCSGKLGFKSICMKGDEQEDTICLI